VATVIGGGVVKPRVGKYSEALGLNHGIISGERGVTMVSPSNPRPGGENSTGTLPKFKVRETKIFNFIPDNGARNVSVEVTSGLQQR
jgi:hypothetical protein